MNNNQLTKSAVRLTVHTTQGLWSTADFVQILSLCLASDYEVEHHRKVPLVSNDLGIAMFS